MFIPCSHAGLTCAEYCKYIRVLLHSECQRKRTVGTLTPLRALRHLVKDIGGATSFIPMEWEISYSSSFYRHPERICVEQ